MRRLSATGLSITLAMGTEDGSTDATQVTIAHGATIADSGFTRFGYSFDGWNTKPMVAARPIGLASISPVLASSLVTMS